tara:strand:+ start:7637 stop:8470 length:834 start_codon:yes stop_codon:yes gene_type:complete
MADSKISDLTALTTTASGDSLPIVDASASATKKITVQNLFKEIPVSVGINFDSPALKLHVVNDLASSPLYASNQCAVFEDDNRPGIQMAGSANNIGLIDFGDNAAFNSGGIHYKHASDSFAFVAAGDEQVTISNGVLGPVTDSDVDLGTSSLYFKDAYIDSITTTGALNGALKRWTVKTANYTAVAGDRVLADTSGGAWTLTLPASPAVGDEIHILDSTASFDTNNLTVARNSLKLQAGTADLTLTTENTGIGLVYMSSTYGWRVLIDAYDVTLTEL